MPSRQLMRTLAVLLTVTLPLTAQAPTGDHLIHAILSAEDRRDAGDASLTVGAAHADPLIQQLALRARARIADSHFVARAPMPSAAPPPAYPDPAWRLRYRALGARDVACDALRAGLTDSAWPVRFRAAAVLTDACADAATRAALQRWIDALPPGDIPRMPGEVTWHGAAHALVALARLAPAEAVARLPTFAAHPTWQVRVYAVRAATALRDSSHLRTAMGDDHPNVRAAAIAALARSTNPVDRAGFVRALRSDDVPTVLAAARALADAEEPEARRTAHDTFRRWATRDSDTERDVRQALLRAAGRPVTEDKAAAPPPPVPVEAIALVRGADARVRVTMAHGGVFIVRLRGDVAPITAARVLALARDDYYDGRSWHRVEHDFVIQGGSPAADEYVGHPRFFRDELGLVSHLRGTVGMSTRGHDTGDAQWFVNLRDNSRLDRDYTVFGEIVAGMDVVDGLLEGDVIASVESIDSR